MNRHERNTYVIRNDGTGYVTLSHMKARRPRKKRGFVNSSRIVKTVLENLIFPYHYSRKSERITKVEIGQVYHYDPKTDILIPHLPSINT